jgi:Icc-related predicted phosphoesterase
MLALTRLLVASDLHASSACFRKCLGLAIETSADILVLAGDFHGKQVIKITHPSDDTFAYVDEEGTERIMPRALFQQKREQWNEHGSYVVIVNANSDESAYELGEAVAATRLAQWLDYGARKLPSLHLISVPGNDDPPALVSILQHQRWNHDVDGRVHEASGYEFFGLGYSNETSWDTPRELSEMEIAKRLADVGNKIKDWKRAIGIIHVPPYDSGLDLAPELKRLSDGSLRITGKRLVPCGSKSVRDFILNVNPLLVISGHCHSSYGIRKLGSTTCVNPGSAFNAGILLARLIILDNGRIIGEQRFVR